MYGTRAMLYSRPTLGQGIGLTTAHSTLHVVVLAFSISNIALLAVAVLGMG